MSHNPLLLKLPFSAKVCGVLDACRARGIEMRIYCTLRTPQEQAILWRQSRSAETINAKLAELYDAKAYYLAHVLNEVGPRFGRPVTNAIPGLSWHQWGLAVDAYWLVDGAACWSTEGGVNGYRVWAEEAEAAGLTAGGHWRRFKDWPHIQCPNAGVLDVHTLQEVDAAMRERFSPRAFQDWLNAADVEAIVSAAVDYERGLVPGTQRWELADRRVRERSGVALAELVLSWTTTV